VPNVVEGELMPTNAAEIALLSCMGMTVFDDADGAAPRALQTVHTSFNTRRAQESTTVTLSGLTNPAYGAIFLSITATEADFFMAVAGERSAGADVQAPPTFASRRSEPQ